MSNLGMNNTVGISYPFGVHRMENGNINFAMPIHTKLECGVALFHKKTNEKIEIVFEEHHRIGNVYAMQLIASQIADYDYMFYEGNHAFVDNYAKRLVGNEKWGQDSIEQLRGRMEKSGFDWGNDKLCMIPYEESILYLLHVRGFTKHTSSKVKNKGTFEGVIEKIPYLKELGITAIECMPVYDFGEVSPREKAELTMEEMVKSYKEDYSKQGQDKINYWGYTEGFYFTPKNAYSAKGNGNESFKQMVKEMHHNGIEVILQFYFSSKVKQAYMIEVLKYWALEYHVDGFRVMGENIPWSLIATEPTLCNRKLLLSQVDEHQLYDEKEIPFYRNVARYQDDFMKDMRHFLKSDEDSLGNAMDKILYSDQKIGTINYMTNYYGFTLWDLISYNKKHNEENGDNDKDGEVNNLSWNCGAEGKTKKKNVLALRKKQYKNALTLLFLSQGTPVLLMGDEFGNSQGGNNNPYCQDNVVSWLNWKDKDINSELYQFAKDMIVFRKNNPMFSDNHLFKMSDYLSCGYPDVSIHGEEAWKIQEDSSECFAGIMYCGKYEKEEMTSIYVAYNMHWEPHCFALPKLSGKSKWEVLFQTEESVLEKGIIASNEELIMKNEVLKKDIMVSPRSVTVLIERA